MILLAFGLPFGLMTVLKNLDKNNLNQKLRILIAPLTLLFLLRREGKAQTYIGAQIKFRHALHDHRVVLICCRQPKLYNRSKVDIELRVDPISIIV